MKNEKRTDTNKWYQIKRQKFSGFLYGLITVKDLVLYFYKYFDFLGDKWLQVKSLIIWQKKKWWILSFCLEIYIEMHCELYKKEIINIPKLTKIWLIFDCPWFMEIFIKVDSYNYFVYCLYCLSCFCIMYLLISCHAILYYHLLFFLICPRSEVWMNMNI